MERVTDEEAGEGGWFWNEQVGSYRPPGALYCRECGVRIRLRSVYLYFKEFMVHNLCRCSYCCMSKSSSYLFV